MRVHVMALASLGRFSRGMDYVEYGDGGLAGSEDNAIGKNSNADDEMADVSGGFLVFREQGGIVGEAVRGS